MRRSSTTFLNQVAYLEAPQSQALAQLFVPLDGFTAFFEGVLFFDRHQTSYGQTVFGNRDFLVRLRFFEQLGEVGLGFVGSDAIALQPIHSEKPPRLVLD